MRTRDVDRVQATFERLVGDFFDRFDGAAFFSDGAFVVYDHPCT